MAVEPPTEQQIREWPATVSVPAAGTVWKMGRRKAYELARKDEFPVPVTRTGSGAGRLTVSTADIMHKLGLEPLPADGTAAGPEPFGADSEAVA